MDSFKDRIAKQNQDMPESFRAAFETEDIDAISIDGLYMLTSGDIDLAKSLLVLFKGQAQKYLSDYNQSQTQDDKVHAVHALKGAARCIAAHKLSDIAADIEKAVRQGAILADEQVNEFMHLTEDVMNYITLVETRSVKLQDGKS